MRQQANEGGSLRVIGYGRVSTEEQADSRGGLDAQRGAIEEACASRGWPLIMHVEDPGQSAKNLSRPGIQAALGRLRAGDADVLMVAKLDRLSRSMRDFSELLEGRSTHEGWRIVALDLGVDTTTPTGEAMANMTATFSRLERRLVSQRTREALAAKRAQGVRLGRPRSVRAQIVTRILAERTAGRTQQAIAEGLNADAVPRSRGGARWYQSTIRSLLVGARGASERPGRSSDPGNAP